MFDFELQAHGLNELTYFKGSSPFIYLMHTCDMKRGHNMLALMFDPRFKTMLLVTMYVGCEIIVVVVVEYDKNYYCLY